MKPKDKIPSCSESIKFKQSSARQVRDTQSESSLFEIIAPVKNETIDKIKI